MLGWHVFDHLVKSRIEMHVILASIKQFVKKKLKQITSFFYNVLYEQFHRVNFIRTDILENALLKKIIIIMYKFIL